MMKVNPDGISLNQNNRIILDYHFKFLVSSDRLCSERFSITSGFTPISMRYKALNIQYFSREDAIALLGYGKDHGNLGNCIKVYWTAYLEVQENGEAEAVA